MSRRIVPVSRLIAYIKANMEKDPVLHGVMIEGEISNFRRPSSGHWYFSLKDDRSSIPVVMFAAANRRLNFQPRQGDKVVLIGDVTVYEAEGRMQMIASGMQPTGIGDLYLRLEALKKKLNGEGLFASEHKKPIPSYIMNLALVTGNNTAAREDVLITLKRRWPIAEIHEYPCPVQGAEAAPKIIEALRRADEGNHQVILLVRGGGSLEDLWCFNDENLARCIYDLKTPVITGVGHEIDTTIADLAADLRANTPTGAAEAAVPDMAEVQAEIRHLRMRMIAALKRKDETCRIALRRVSDSPVLRYPERLLQQPMMRLDVLESRLMRTSEVSAIYRQRLNGIQQKFVVSMHHNLNDMSRSAGELTRLLQQSVEEAMRRETQKQALLEDALKMHTGRRLEIERLRLEQDLRLLDAYSPLKIMDRGYSVVYKNDHVITGIDEVHAGDCVDVRLSNGTFTAEVTGRKD